MANVIAQEFTTLYTPAKSSFVERFFRSLEDEYIWLRPLRIAEPSQGRVRPMDWYYNNERPFQSLNNVTPRARLIG